MRNPVIHLELHTTDQARASELYAGLLGWRTKPIRGARSSYMSLGLGDRCGGGIVECGTPRAMWLPYVAVDRIDEVTDRAGRMGAQIVLEPREGAVGFRSVIETPEGGEIALWQAKERRLRA